MRVRGVLTVSPKARALLAAAACYILWQGWLTVRAPGKVAPSLPRAGGAGVDILVTLPFPPERFHVLVFQQFGRVSGTRENQVELRGVKASHLRAVARPYWVSRVDSLPREQGR